ncbi:hypothetical protein ACHAW5_011312 [Stephanodiscus triporus]|uniref:Cationic amino acid transporter n=1 Tax=Stephanodiscus triporus TaxID=2934178 RepID=A0ABD3NJ73_9STRA
MQAGYGSVPFSDADAALQYNDDADNGSGGGKANTHRPQHSYELHRHMSLFDLVSVGVGATVGSGVFVLTGLIAHTLSGPAVSVSWLIAGLAACASGLCYAELGGRFPSVGSTYVYAKETMGDCAAVIAGACLTLDASAVARSWGDKVVEYVKSFENEGHNSSLYRFFVFALDPGYGLNFGAFFVSLGLFCCYLMGSRKVNM